jgi:hypothetical protein
VINTVFAVIWARRRRCFCWRAYLLVGWGLGLSFQHFSAVVRGQITEEDVRRKLRPGAEGKPGGKRQRDREAAQNVGKVAFERSHVA